MPRIARAVAASFPHHVVQRGNNKETVFFNEKDRLKYIHLIGKYSDKWKSPVLAYCLMTNHVHLLIKPKENESLYKMMQGVTLCYTQYVNRRYGRTGRLWESRYHSCIVDKDSYLWAVARYIETNPVRAGIVERAEDYAYSSARHHIIGDIDDVLGEELVEEEQRKDYHAFISDIISEKDIKVIRYHTKTGRPLGDERFTEKMEKKMGRKFSQKQPGRPRKQKAE
jgi:REP-associated tyrosine transposase